MHKHRLAESGDNDNVYARRDWRFVVRLIVYTSVVASSVRLGSNIPPRVKRNHFQRLPSTRSNDVYIRLFSDVKSKLDDITRVTYIVNAIYVPRRRQLIAANNII